MKLRNVLLAQVALFSFAGATSSFAGPYSWTGGYVGAEGGYGWGTSSQTDPGFHAPCVGSLCAGNGSYFVGGGFIGGTAGYNLFQPGPWVLGIEADYSWANITGETATCGYSSAHSCGATLQAFGTVRGRVGYAVGPDGNWLPYVTGGLAVGEVQAWDSLTPASGSAFRGGWTVGAGIEAAFAKNWTARVEYLYMDLGSAQLFDIVPGVAETVSFRANLIRVGVDYKFNGPEPPRPLVAKN